MVFSLLLPALRRMSCILLTADEEVYCVWYISLRMVHWMHPNLVLESLEPRDTERPQGRMYNGQGVDDSCSVPCLEGLKHLHIPTEAKLCRQPRRPLIP